MNTIKVDRQFMNEYEEVYSRLGYHPRGVVIPCVTVHQTYALGTSQPEVSRNPQAGGIKTMSRYEKQFNAEIAKVLKEAEQYTVSPYQINWLNVFYHVREKVNQVFQAGEA